MALEPMTLFSRMVEPAKVAARLRTIAPSVALDGPDESWRTALVTFAVGGRKWSLKLTHDPVYYAEPSWSTQMAGMHGYLATFPKSERQESSMMLTSTFRFALGVVFEPDDDANNDPRFAVLYDIATLLDGVFFTPSALRDARGRVLFAIGRNLREDPDAEWPRVRASVDLANARQEEPSPAPTDTTIDPPSAQRVARRALALTAVTARAALEQGENLKLEKKSLFGRIRGYFGGAEPNRVAVCEWIDSLGIREELEPEEWRILQCPVGQLPPEVQGNTIWRIEGLVVLAWALGRAELPPHDQLVRWHPLWERLGLLDLETARNLLAAPMLRPREEFEPLRARLFTLHWRLRSFWIKPDAIDFPQFVSTNHFGLDLAGIPIVENDLAIGGQRIDRAPQEQFARAHSAALERHTAINWIREGPELYSDASQST